MGVLSNLEPSSVFRYFEEICGIPHGSSNTKEISDYCVRFAEAHGLRYIQDDYNNVIIYKDGTKGYENSAPVMMQGHLDMVCEKDAGCDIDFTADGLNLEVSDGFVTAKGTTLGADDGIAVAYCLAILESEDIVHPPLEVVFTVDEEIGMLGAAAIDCSPLNAGTMLNIDSEDEGCLLVSCAGGISVVAHLPVEAETVSGYAMSLKISGLLGGHSGVEIDKGRANACQVLGRVLYRISRDVSFRLLSVNGGLKDNAIPNKANAELVVEDEKSIAKIEELAEGLDEILKKEYRVTDGGISITLTKTGNSSDKESVGNYSKEDYKAWNRDTTNRVITALVNLPGGIQRMSFDIEDLVQTSLNLGIMSSTDTEVIFSYAVRSSVESEKRELVDRVTCLMEALGGTVTCSGEYPAWEYKKESKLRDLMIEIYKEQCGSEPVVQAIHAGVECGLFAGKIPGLDCVSFGPDLKDIHTTKETMDVQSVKRTWEYILEILRRLK